MDYNLHTHTIRCSHALGQDEEYVIRAIDRGLKVFGFSDHVPLALLDGFESTYRVQTKDASDYALSVNALKEKYKEKIKIYLGFEMEYYPDIFDDMLKYVKDLGAEYLVLGQHFIGPEYPRGNNNDYTYYQTDDIKVLKKYCDLVVEGIKTGVFTYVCHPDIINFNGDIKTYREQVERICKASKEYDVPLEINFLGIRENRVYPREEFWSVAGKIGSPVTFGSDAHNPMHVVKEDDLITAKEIVKKYDLNYIGRPKIIKI
jgi:histidinol-phosphatase (PHP family)